MASVDDSGQSHIQTQLEGLNVNMNNLKGDLKTMLDKRPLTQKHSTEDILLFV
jgi:hypothetical protein